VTVRAHPSPISAVAPLGQPPPPCKRQTGLPRMAGARQGSLERRHLARQRGAARAKTKAVCQSGLQGRSPDFTSTPTITPGLAASLDRAGRQMSQDEVAPRSPMQFVPASGHQQTGLRTRRGNRRPSRAQKRDSTSFEPPEACGLGVLGERAATDGQAGPVAVGVDQDRECAAILASEAPEGSADGEAL
jgi:hypothetical protein